MPIRHITDSRIPPSRSHTHACCSAQDTFCWVSFLLYSPKLTVGEKYIVGLHTFDNTFPFSCFYAVGSLWVSFYHRTITTYAQEPRQHGPLYLTTGLSWINCLPSCLTLSTSWTGTPGLFSVAFMPSLPRKRRKFFVLVGVLKGPYRLWCHNL